MTGFADPDFAIETRDVLVRLVQKVVAAERPAPRYGVVTSIDRNARTVSVQFPGEPAPTANIKVTGLEPASTGVTVRVEGTIGDRYISGIMGQTFSSDAVATQLTAPVLSPLTSMPAELTFDWTAITGATRYEVQVGINTSFTFSPEIYFKTAPSTVLTISNQPEGATRFARVRAVNNNGTGPWSNTVSKVVTTFSEVVPLSDGNPPSSSPAATVRGARNILYVTWPRTPNADPVTYEVFISTESGFVVNADEATGNKVGEIDGTTFVISQLPDGTALQENVGYYVRIRATDRDGVADNPGTEGFGVVDGVSDGVVPANSPTPTVTSGLSFLDISWPKQANKDPITYEVHVGTVSGFTPAAASLAGETTLTGFLAYKRGGNKLAYSTNYFVRLVAKDIDGPGPVGAQAGPIQLAKIELGDVGNVPSSSIRDGVAPSSSPTAPSVASGIGFLFVKWDHASNPDQLTYEVHISTASNFVPDANTRVLDTTANYSFIRTQGPGVSRAALVYGTTYYIKIWAKDLDGYAAAASGEASGFTVRAGTPDITVGSITAASGIIADAAIETAKIVDLAVTRGKIALLAVDTAQINDLAVETAKINNLAVLNAKIANATIESAKVNTISAASIVSSSVTAAIITLGSGGILRAGVVANNTARVEYSASGIRMISRDSLGGDSVTVNLPISGSPTFSGNINASGGSISGNLSVSGQLTGGTYEMTLASRTLRLSGSPTFAGSDGYPQITWSGNGTTFGIASGGNTLTVGPGTVFDSSRVRIDTFGEVGMNHLVSNHQINNGQIRWRRNTGSVTWSDAPVLIENATVTDNQYSGVLSSIMLGIHIPGRVASSIHYQTDRFWTFRKDKGLNPTTNQGFDPIAAQSFFSTSDVSLKEDIKGPPADVLTSRVKAIKPIQFKFKGSEDGDGRVRQGFKADDFEALGLATRVDTALCLDALEVVAVLWQAVRELSEQVDALKPKVSV